MKKYNFMQIFIENTKFNIVTGCIEWVGIVDPNGYGHMSINSKRISPHRFYYQYFLGEIPSYLDIDHLCSNKRCVNIEHLEAVTRSTNLQRYHNSVPDRTHCKRGHELIGNNIRIYRGYIRCVQCEKIHNKFRSDYLREWRKRNKNNG